MVAYIQVTPITSDLPFHLTLIDLTTIQKLIVKSLTASIVAD